VYVRTKVHSTGVLLELVEVTNFWHKLLVRVDASPRLQVSGGLILLDWILPSRFLSPDFELRS
jgi:hypothetical protein